MQKLFVRNIFVSIKEPADGKEKLNLLKPNFFTEVEHWTVLFFYICAISLKMSKTKTISETLLQNSYYASKNNQSNFFYK